MNALVAMMFSLGYPKRIFLKKSYSGQIVYDPYVRYAYMYDTWFTLTNYTNSQLLINRRDI